MADKDGNIWSKNERRKVMPPTASDRGWEKHPAWVMCSVHRVATTPGAVLFDSDIRHSHYVSVKIERAERERSLNHDHIMGRERLIEIDMSEAQWAAFVSSVNTTGVPATMRAFGDDWLIPEMPYEPRLQESLDEVRDAGAKAMEKIKEAFAAYKEHKTVKNLRYLESTLDNLPGNLAFAAKSLEEHAENVVTKARFDIEAAVMRAAASHGLEAGDVVGSMPELTAGDES